MAVRCIRTAERAHLPSRALLGEHLHRPHIAEVVRTRIVGVTTHARLRGALGVVDEDEGIAPNEGKAGGLRTLLVGFVRFRGGGARLFSCRARLWHLSGLAREERCRETHHGDGGSEMTTEHVARALPRERSKSMRPRTDRL